MTTSRLRGMSQSTPCRLWTRAPRIEIGSSLGGFNRALVKRSFYQARHGPAGLRPAPGPDILRGSAPAAFERSGPSMSTQKPAPVVDRRSPQAIPTFEKAMKAMAKHDYERAREHFDALLSGFPEERDLLERARSYRAVCERALEKRPAFRPKTFEELLHHGVYLHNRGEYEEALKFLRQAAELPPRNEHVVYCMAARAARAGNNATALKSLRQAVTAGPANRAQARQDPDFDGIREDEEFLSILYPQAS